MVAGRNLCLWLLVLLSMKLVGILVAGRVVLSIQQLLMLTKMLLRETAWLALPSFEQCEQANCT